MPDRDECVETSLRPVSASDALEYIGDMTRELAQLAEPTKLPMLVYHLQAARDICLRAREQEIIDKMQLLHDEAFVVLPSILHQALFDDSPDDTQS